MAPKGVRVLQAKALLQAGSNRKVDRTMKMAALASLRKQAGVPLDDVAVPASEGALCKKEMRYEETGGMEAAQGEALAPKAPKPPSRTQAMIAAIQRTIASIPYKASPAAGVKLHPAALVTADPDGFPSSRTVVLSFLAQDLSVLKLRTQEGTRKLAELEANPRAAVHFQDQRGRGGWVTLKGDCTVLPATPEPGMVEIKLTAERVEAMSYTEELMADDDGWKPASMVRVEGAWRRVR